jgi:hypothetical protein
MNNSETMGEESMLTSVFLYWKRLKKKAWGHAATTAPQVLKQLKNREISYQKIQALNSNC